jgi:methylenetetrahydrofolate reductase (NADPH)
MLVHNDFHQSHGIFSLFDELEVADMDKSADLGCHTNGVNGHEETGESGVNGVNGADNTQKAAEQ